jgi:transposase
VVVFNIYRRRSQEAAKALLGEDFAGAICSDRFGAYNWIERRGYCWAHLERDFQAMAERFGSEWYGCRLVAGAKRVMTSWRLHEDGEISRQERDGRLTDERRRIYRLLVSAKERAPVRKTRRECAELLKTQERILSTVLSLRMQQHDVFEFLIQAPEAAAHDFKPPSLCLTT